jgi:hypothetical protein
VIEWHVRPFLAVEREYRLIIQIKDDGGLRGAVERHSVCDGRDLGRDGVGRQSRKGDRESADEAEAAA